MKTAYLYIRVSTDEQAIKGFSQRSQKDRLIQYCRHKEIQILEILQEDHSAKTFHRPMWSTLMVKIRKGKAPRPDLILFTKWDRFSRNVGDAYYMMNLLQKFGIQPQAIDQELDFGIPENKIILAVYLAASEAENERRSLNVKKGIRKAKQEGRWIAHVPIGYKATLNIDGHKYICPQEPEATFIRNSFIQVSCDNRPIKKIYQYAIRAGLKCSKSHFSRILRNPVYCGKVLIPAFENQTSYSVTGNFEPIVGEALFNKVQSILREHKRQIVTKQEKAEYLFLRGYFHCSRCDRKLTGSTSKGKTSYYHYYHCTSPCSFRVRADKINRQFNDQISNLVPDKRYVELYKKLLTKIRKVAFAEHTVSQKAYTNSIARLIERIVKAKELLLQNEIDAEDFQLIKEDCEKRISTVGIELQQSAMLERKRKQELNKAAHTLYNIGVLVQSKDLSVKHQILKLILNTRPLLHNSLNFYDAVSLAVRMIYNVARPAEHSVTEIDYRKHFVEDDLCINTSTEEIMNERIPKYVHDFLIGLARIPDIIK